MAGTSLFDPADFRIGPDVAHLCAAGESAFLRRHQAAFEAYARDKSGGMAGRALQFEHEARARALAAARFGVPAPDAAFVSNVAEGVAMLVESLEWAPGDNVCVQHREFPSLVLPFAMREDGPQVRLAEGGFAPCVDARTRVIAVSHVSYLTGIRQDLAALRRLADGVGALLVVDFTQSAGVLAVDAAVADFAFAACYKFLLGSTGVAVAIWNRARRPGWVPRSGGWNSVQPEEPPDYSKPAVPRPDAARFTRGNPSLPSVYVLESALDYLAGHETEALEEHVAGLAGEMLEGLAELGIEPLTALDPGRRGPSVAFACPDAAGLGRRLAERGVLAWSGDGRVRLSFHGYNGARDVERALDALRREWRDRPAAQRRATVPGAPRAGPRSGRGAPPAGGPGG